MSSSLYPTLKGLAFGVKRYYEWKSGVQEALSGKQSAIAYRAYPLVKWELTYEFLSRNYTPDDLQAVLGLYNQVQGRYDTFLFSDPDFNTIASAQASQYGAFWTSDGTTTGPHPLLALFQNSGGPGGAELIQNLNGTPVLYDNGSAIASANYTIDATGNVTFGAGHVPASGHSVTWSGSFYYRCRFDDDAIEFTKFSNNLWKATVKMTSVKL